MDTYVVDQLSSALNIAGKKLYVHISNLPPAEDFACTTQGPTFPHLKILHATERN
jgi:hypothetical protein